MYSFIMTQDKKPLSPPKKNAPYYFVLHKSVFLDHRVPSIWDKPLVHFGLIVFPYFIQINNTTTYN